ncbi:MAG: DUF1467 family protein [Pseudomonadota bacterium]
MELLSAIALFFIIWWVVLFAVLPVGVRSQAEDGEATLGTEHGAPVRPEMGKKMLMTTAISAVVFGVYFFVTVVLGYSFDDLPRVVPDSS